MFNLNNNFNLKIKNTIQLITNEDYIRWGKSLLEKANEIYAFEIEHKRSVVEIIEDINKKYNLFTDEEKHFYQKVDFYTKSRDNLHRNGPGPDYWLNYISKFPYDYKWTTWKESVIRIIEGYNEGIIYQFRNNHFDNNRKFDLFNPFFKLNLIVDDTHNYYQVEFAIKVIERLTTLQVDKILFQVSHPDSDGNLPVVPVVIIAIDDPLCKLGEYPSIIKENFFKLKFLSSVSWYHEIPEFKNYIDQWHNSTKCQVCRMPVSKDTYGFWCDFCNRPVTDEGDFKIDDFDCYDETDSIEVVENDDPYYLFFDTETTGVPLNYKAPASDLDNWPRLVQLAFIAYNEKGEKIKTYNKIIRPDGFIIPEEAARIHGISNIKALEEGVPLEEALVEFYKYVSKAKLLVAHNMAFDEKIMGAELLRKSFTNIIEGKNRFCTMIATIDYCAIQGYYGYKWPKLSELHHKLFGVDFENAHDAMSDIEATAKCFWELLDRSIISDPVKKLN